MAEWTGLPNNGATGPLHGPPLPACHVDDAPVLAAARHGNNCIVVPQARTPFDAAPRCDDGNRTHIRGILQRRGQAYSLTSTRQWECGWLGQCPQGSAPGGAAGGGSLGVGARMAMMAAA
jgi:hypothetical protein